MRLKLGLKERMMGDFESEHPGPILENLIFVSPETEAYVKGLKPAVIRTNFEQAGIPEAEIKKAIANPEERIPILLKRGINPAVMFKGGMSLKEQQLLAELERAGYSLPKNAYALHEARRGINPKTGNWWYEDKKGQLWSWDDREKHWDVLTRKGYYYRISEKGKIIGKAKSTVSFPH